MSAYKKKFHLPKKRKCRSSRSRQVSLENENTTECKFDILNSDILEYIASFLGTASALALYRSSRGIMNKLIQCPGFWKALCKKENFHTVYALKKDDEDGIERVSWAGNPLHGVEPREDSTLWYKVFMRGLQMRRNVCSGNYEWWRLFMTDEENLPVKKMTKDTTFRELRSIHRRSCFNKPERRIEITYEFNEDYFVTIQQTSSMQFKDIFVYKWDHLQNPKFLYSVNLLPVFEAGLSMHASFIYKKYLVLIPESMYTEDGTRLRSMVRAYDLSSEMTLVGSYDFPENGYRRVDRRNETCFLTNVGDYAVALCRAPNFIFFIFSLPNCDLLHTFPIIADPERPLENDTIEEFELLDYEKGSSFLLRFDHPELFESNGELHVRLLLIDFENFLKSGEPIIQRLDNKFDSVIVSYEEAEFHMINKTQMALLTRAGDLIIRDMVITSPNTISFVDRLSIPSPEPVYMSMIEQEFWVSHPSDLIYVFRCFESEKRKIHAYTNEGVLEYVIEIDTPELEMDLDLSFKTNGRFLCAIDEEMIAIWDSKTGKFIKTIDIPGHYGFRKEKHNPADTLASFLDETSANCRDFYFIEDGIIIIYSKRNFPIAADVVLFW